MIEVDKQHVELAVVERRHDVFEHGGRHLPVRHRDAHFRHILVEKFFGVGEVLDARADIKGLAAAVALAQERLAHHDRIERRDERAHRQPIDRRRGDDRHFAHAGERELQRARDRRRGEREHVHLGAQLLELLLVRDAEMLLLVDDDEAEIPEFDGLAEQRMGADDDVDGAVGDAFFHLGEFGRRRRAARLARCAPDSRASDRRKSSCAGAPAASSAPRPRPACRSSR